jgi:hypothetical protein
LQSLGKAVERSKDTGSALPNVYESFKFRFRRGATSMIAGAPGTYKSTLALNLLSRWADKGITGLYISADSDEFTVGKRMAAIRSGDKVSQVERYLREGAYAETLNMPGVRFGFVPLDMRKLDQHVRGFESVYGSFPDVIFVDNLTNAIDSGGEEFGAMRQMTKDLDVLARASRSHVMILHHTSESWESVMPPPRWRVMGKVTAIPRLVLTLGCEGNMLHIATVKDSNGPQDASGQTYESLYVDTDTMRVRDLPRGAA